MKKDLYLSTIQFAEPIDGEETLIIAGSFAISKKDYAKIKTEGQKLLIDIDSNE